MKRMLCLTLALFLFAGCMGGTDTPAQADDNITDTSAAPAEAAEAPPVLAAVPPALPAQGLDEMLFVRIEEDAVVQENLLDLANYAADIGNASTGTASFTHYDDGNFLSSAGYGYNVNRNQLVVYGNARNPVLLQNGHIAGIVDGQFTLYSRWGDLERGQPAFEGGEYFVAAATYDRNRKQYLAACMQRQEPAEADTLQEMSIAIFDKKGQLAQQIAIAGVPLRQTGDGQPVGPGYLYALEDGQLLLDYDGLLYCIYPDEASGTLLDQADIDALLPETLQLVMEPGCQESVFPRYDACTYAVEVDGNTRIMRDSRAIAEYPGELEFLFGLTDEERGVSYLCFAANDAVREALRPDGYLTLDSVDRYSGPASLDGCSNYLQKNLDALGAAITGELGVWRDDNAVPGSQQQYPAYPVDFGDGEIWHCGVDSYTGALYRWRDGDNTKPEELETVAVFPTPQSALEYGKTYLTKEFARALPMYLQYSDEGLPYYEELPHKIRDDREYYYVIDVDSTGGESYTLHFYSVSLSVVDGMGQAATTEWATVHRNGFIRLFSSEYTLIADGVNAPIRPPEPDTAE